MTNSQIKQELRRSACEDEYPRADGDCFSAASSFVDYDADEWVSDLGANDKRTFFLIVAEAIE